MGRQPETHGGPADQSEDLAEMPDLSGSIGANLKALYQALEQEPLPDLFINLLQKLDEAEDAR